MADVAPVSTTALAVGLAVALAWAARAAVRRRPVPSAAIERVRRELLLRHPDVRWNGFVPASLTALVVVDGQETPVPLHRVLRRAEEIDGALAQLVDQLVAEIRSAGLDRVGGLAFHEVASELVPQLRTRAFVDERGGRFGDGALLWRSLGADLGVCLAIDRGDDLVFVCRALARRWERDDDELLALAVANLRRRGVATLPRPARGESVVLRSGDGLDAARLCLLDWDAADGLHVVVPDRDLLWIGDVEEAVARAVCDAVGALDREGRLPHAVGSQLYRVRSGSIERVGSCG